MSSGGFNVPRGHGYHPSDKELLTELEEKNHCKGSHITIIPEFNVCKFEPHELAELAFTAARNLARKFFYVFFFWFMTEEDTWHSQNKWYFFAPVDYKYTKSSRANRTTGEGYWKITGKDRAINDPTSKLVIGRKRTLTFYKRGGVSKAERTGWVIHEYFLIQGHCDTPKQIGEYVVCCLKYKSDGASHDEDVPFCNKGSSSCSIKSNIENQEMVDGGITSNRNEAEGVSGMIALHEEYLTLEELQNALEIPIDDDNDFERKQTDLRCVEQNDHSTSVEPQPDRSNSFDMVNELLDDLENLDSLFDSPAPPQLHQLNLSPKYAVDVHKDESRKRACPFENDDPSVLKKNKISVSNDNYLLSNITYSPENQAANVIPMEYSQPGSQSGSFVPMDGYTQPSINGEQRDFNDDVIGLDDLMPWYHGIESPLIEFPNTVTDEVNRGCSDDDCAAFNFGAFAPE